LQNKEDDGHDVKRSDRVLTFLGKYSKKRRQWILDDAKLSLSQYLLKIGLIFAFLMADLIFVPSLMQLLIPVSTTFFLTCIIGIILLAYLEKKALDRIIKIRNMLR